MITIIKRIISFVLIVVLAIIIPAIYTFSNPETISDDVFIKKVYLRTTISSKNIGESIYFGNYEQDGKFEDGKEPVEWIILEKDDNSALLLSKFIIDCYPFNGFHHDVTWENCSLRNVMNSTMLNEMFNSAEQQCIIPMYLQNSSNIFNGAYSGEPTIDLLFIPSIDDMIKYFSNDNFVNEARLNEMLRPNVNRMCYATTYAIDRGVRVQGPEKKYPGTGNYFLRTSGLKGLRRWYSEVYAEYFQSFVTEGGAIKPDGTGLHSIDDGIRPMLKVSY